MYERKEESGMPNIENAEVEWHMMRVIGERETSTSSMIYVYVYHHLLLVLANIHNLVNKAN